MFFMEMIEHIRHLPELDEETIHIWGIHVPGVLDRLEDLEPSLSAEEREKADRYHRIEDRHSSVAARGALRILLSAYSGIPAKEIHFNYSEHGKPHAVGSEVDFNVSHSGEWVVLAFGRNRRIGIDVEMIKPELDVMAVAERYFTPEEILLMGSAEDRPGLFFDLWARKEAYVKACGSTLFKELSRCSIPVGDHETKDGWIFHRLKAGSKYAAAVVTDKPVRHMPCYDFGGLRWES